MQNDLAPTPPPSVPALPGTARARLTRLLSSGRRSLLGLVGPPGSGKSTLAQRCSKRSPRAAQVVPMDGFHLANVELARLGRAGRKGAPDTFDAAGYVDLLRRLRQQADDEIVYAPEFRREIEEPIAGAIAVLPQTAPGHHRRQLPAARQGAWAGWRGCSMTVWYVDVDDGLRTERLVARHAQFGRSRSRRRRVAYRRAQRAADRRHARSGRLGVCVGRCLSAFRVSMSPVQTDRCQHGQEQRHQDPQWHRAPAPERCHIAGAGGVRPPACP